MRRMFDYKCPDGHRFEAFIDVDDKSLLPCKTCGKNSQRILTYGGPVLDPISGDFRSATRRWTLNRHIKIKQERREAESHGPSHL